jgi:hypothetical protein
MPTTDAIARLTRWKTWLVSGLVFGLIACAGKQHIADPATKTVINQQTDTFEIPDSRYRRNVRLYEHVKLLPESVLNKARTIATEVSDGQLVFPPGLQKVNELERGDILLSRHGQGFARKVRAIERTDDAVTLHLTRAHLNEVVASGNFYFGPTQRIEFDNGNAYAPPTAFTTTNGPDDDQNLSERQQRFRATSAPVERPETFFRLGPRAKKTDSVVHSSGNLTSFLNRKLNHAGLGTQLDFTHQITDLEMATSVRMDMCRGTSCANTSPANGLARLEQFDVRSHGWIDTNTKLRYTASSLVVPDANANNTPDWREEGLEDFHKLHIISTHPEDDSIFNFRSAGGYRPVRRQFEVVPGVHLRVDYDVTVGLQVLGERPMDVETGFEFTAQGGCRSEPDATLSPWPSPIGVDGTCGRTMQHTWHTRPVFDASEPTGDTLRVRIRIEPEITTEFTGGIDGNTRTVPFGGDHRFDQHVSAPQVGNCSTVAQSTGYGRHNRQLAPSILSADKANSSPGLQPGGGATNTFRRRLDFNTDHLAIPGICNVAWTPPFASAASPGDNTCNSASSLRDHSQSSSCPMLRVETARYCQDRENNPIDTDDDGVPNRLDGCPCTFNPDQLDSDGNGDHDVCDSDADEADGENWEDNCPVIVNPDQQPGPVEGVGAACTPNTDLFCGVSPVRVRTVPAKLQSNSRYGVSCRFHLSGLEPGDKTPELRGYLHIDNAIGTETASNGRYGDPDFWQFDGPASRDGDPSFLSRKDLNFRSRHGGKGIVTLPPRACRAYARAKRAWEDNGYTVSFRLAGGCIPGDSPYRQRMTYCPHSPDPIDVGQDADSLPDPPTPNPTQIYDPRDGESILRTGHREFDPTNHDSPLELWDRCPFQHAVTPKGAERSHSAQSNTNDGTACRVKLEQKNAYSDEAISAIEHESPVFGLEFPDDRQRREWKGNYPLVDYSGDGVLAHHPGYPQTCRPEDIEACQNDATCHVPRCSDNCPTVPNPHQEDRNDNGVGDHCEHADSEPIDRSADAGELFGINNPHYIDSTGHLKIYDSDQDDVPDHLDNCPWDWNASQANINSPDAFRPPGVPNDAGDWHTDQRGNACDPDMDGDGIGNRCDTDHDGDGTPNILDYCPDTALQVSAEKEQALDTESNAPCADSDEDGIPGEPKDYPPLGKDTVSDRWYDAGWAGFDDLDRQTYQTSDGATIIAGADNCPTIENPGQFDLDHDGVGDACDPDFDGDGTPDDANSCQTTANQSDGDGG